MKKRLISMLLVLCMVFSLLPAQVFAAGTGNQPETGSVNPFVDVHPDDWYYDAVQYVYINSIFNGVKTDTFLPDGTMTRGMFVTVLGRMAGVKPENYGGPSVFSDVPENAWYAPFVNWAAKYGITTGTGGGKFSPEAFIDRQQMAVFFGRYFTLFEVEFVTSANITTQPADLEEIAPWARESVLALWKRDLINGDGRSFLPGDNATRAQAATLCMRFDAAVKIWYSEPGVPSERVRPGDEKPTGSSSYAVRFYDGNRLIDTLYARKGKPLGQVPAVEKTSRADAVFEGWYLDEDFTEHFYADAPVKQSTKVYARYTELQEPEVNVDSFTRLDLGADASFALVCTLEPTVPEPAPEPKPDPEDSEQPPDGGEEASEPVDPGFSVNPERIAELLGAVKLTPKDGSATVPLAIEPGENDTLLIAADGGFKEGASYELTLPEGLSFLNEQGETMPDKIRTVSFTIHKDEVAKIAMNEDITYIQDTDGIDYIIGSKTFDVLTPALVPADEGTFTGYTESGELADGDILCFYKETAPADRDYKENAYVDDPEVYAKVTGVVGNTVSFTALTDEDSASMYEVPDNFPVMGSIDNGEGGKLTLTGTDDDGYVLDANAYAMMMGPVDGTLEKALEKISVGDFLSIYVSQESVTSEDAVFFGKITAYDAQTKEITYERSSADEIEKAVDLYVEPVIDGSDLLSEAVKQEIEEAVTEQVEESGFAQQAVSFLAEAATYTDGFRSLEGAANVRVTDENGRALNADEMDLMSLGGAFQARNIAVTARIVTSGDEMHFENGSVRLIVTVEADMELPLNQNTELDVIALKMQADFIQELAVGVTANGELVRKKLLGFIPVPIGVQVGAAVDIRSFTDISADVQIQTKKQDVIQEVLDVSKELENMLKQASSNDLSGSDYTKGLSALMERYSEMLQQETDWIQLVDEQIVGTDIVVYGIAIGLSADFVVRADMNIALGTKLEYQVGKRYSFWFRIGLFKPTAGSDTMDLVDEEFAFQFYVMGKLGMKMGVKGKVALGIGSTTVASVGLALELGPYVKLHGFFIYEYEYSRKANTSSIIADKRMAGALHVEFGLYLIVTFEAQALKLFEYSHDFVNAEYPLLTAGEEQYPYAFQYEPPEDDMVRMIDSDLSTTDVVTMELPEELRAVAYCDLLTGALSAQAFDYDCYNISLSNPAFSFDPDTGIVTVTVPEDTRFISCDMTLTYKYGKLAFSTYDMQVTIPLMWSNLPEEELAVRYTAAVRAGNPEDGYGEIVWSKRVHKGEEFTLPTEAELKKRMAYDEEKYTDFSFPDEGETVSIIQDTLYDCTVRYKPYELTVTGVQNEDGSTRNETFTTRYGGTFDFSALEKTGANTVDDTAPETAKFTRFGGVVTNAVIGDVPVDLKRPVEGSFARALANGQITAEAKYADDSVLATFSFVGITVPDHVERIRKGSLSYYNFNELPTQNDTVVSSITPALGAAVNTSTTYFVECKPITGDMSIHTIDFDTRGGSAVNSLTQVGGSLLPNLRASERRGYTFGGWFWDETCTQPFGTGEKMSATEDRTLYAKWTPNQYKVTFHVDAGETVSETERTVTYDATYGGSNDRALPKPSRPHYGFRRWWTTRDNSGTQVTADTPVQIIENQVLYPHWEPLIQLPAKMFEYTQYQVTPFAGTYTGRAFTMLEPTQLQTVGDLTFKDFYVKYERQEDDYDVAKAYDSLENAGTYNVVIKREPDDYYDKFEQVCSNVAVIERAAYGEIGSVGIKSTAQGINSLTVEATKTSSLGKNPIFTYYAFEESGSQNWESKGAPGDDTLYNLRAGTQYYVQAHIDNHPNYVEAVTGYDFVEKTVRKPKGESIGVNANLDRSNKTINIYKASDLAKVNNWVDNNEFLDGYTINLMNDIDLTETYWDPIGGYGVEGDARPFKGEFNGNGHTITGMYTGAKNYTGGSDFVYSHAGLFALTDGAYIHDVTIKYSYIEGTTAAGAVVGEAKGNTRVENCHNAHTTVVGPAGNTKTVVGIGTDTNCTYTGKVYYR